MVWRRRVDVVMDLGRREGGLGSVCSESSQSSFMVLATILGCSNVIYDCRFREMKKMRVGKIGWGTGPVTFSERTVLAFDLIATPDTT